MEIRRGGVSYTHQTLERLKKRLGGERYLVIGADNIREIRKWRHAEKIFGLAKIAVADRPPFPSLSACAGYRKRMVPLPIVPLEISSSDLRRRLKAGKDVRAWMPGKVLRMILKKGFYR
jgi:nicotinate-nucleotide adenylyltransferase